MAGRGGGNKEKIKNNDFLEEKKFLWPLSSRGGGKALMSWPFVEVLFLRFP